MVCGLYSYKKKSENRLAFSPLGPIFLWLSFKAEKGPQRGRNHSKKGVPSHQTVVQCSESVKQTKNIYNLS